jgi:hypothetical protein
MMISMMRILNLLGIVLLLALSVHGAWDPQLAAKYLDARQQ